MDLKVVAAIAYGALALIGGITGYAKAKSIPSLLAGAVSGILLIVAALLQLQGIAGGLLLARGVTAVLIVVFTLRLLKTRAFMPAGVMLMAGVAALAVMLIP